MTATIEAAPARRLPYVPALDGVRGAAVVAVLLFHHGFDQARGGFLGVSLFFTLSGFLITSLIVSEHHDTGRIDLRTFWARRVRRLAPAALLGLAMALAAAVVVVPAAQKAGVVTDVRAALLQVANWRFVLADAPYADVDTLPSPVLHYWSLAIEEQFYLVLPLLAWVCLRRSRRTLAGALLGITLASLALQWALPADDRVYFGTDTRASELALGGLLALGWPRLRRRIRAPAVWDLVGAAGIAVTLVLWLIVPLSHPVLLDGGLTGVGLVSVAVLLGALGGRRVPQLLSVRPLRWLGLISYGLYVIHFPVFLVLTPQRLGLSGEVTFVIRVAVSLLLAALSLRLLEAPVRAREPMLGLVPLTGRAGRVAIAGAAASVLVGSVGVAQLAAPVGPAPTGLLPEATGPELAGDRPPRLVVVGDSTADAVGTGLQAWAASTGALRVSVVSGPGCAVLAGETARYRPGYEFSPDGCEHLFPRAIEEAERVDADAIAIFLGSPQLADWRFPPDPEWHNILEDEVGSRYQDALDDALQRATATGIPVLVADVPPPDWDLDAFGEMIGGGELPGTGEPVINEPARTERLNALTAEVVAAHDRVALIDYAEGLAGPDGRISDDARADGLHLAPEQVAAAADEWLVDALADAEQRVRTRTGTSAPPGASWAVAEPLP